MCVAAAEQRLWAVQCCHLHLCLYKRLYWMLQADRRMIGSSTAAKRSVLGQWLVSCHKLLPLAASPLHFCLQCGADAADLRGGGGSRAGDAGAVGRADNSPAGRPALRPVDPPLQPPQHLHSSRSPGGHPSTPRKPIAASLAQSILSITVGRCCVCTLVCVFLAAAETEDWQDITAANLFSLSSYVLVVSDVRQ